MNGVPVSVEASAPGSLMLLGEHAVLHGSRALVCAVNRRMHVRLTARSDRRLGIDSALGRYEEPLDMLPDHASFRFILQAVRQYLPEIPSGFDLQVVSDFSATIGFGSSAAVTVAVHAALATWLGESSEPEVLFSRSLETVHCVQGRGSGADLAAAAFGGAVVYSTCPICIPIQLSLPLTAVYCGYKTPTPEVIAQVERLRAADPQAFSDIFQAMDHSVEEAQKALQKEDWDSFGRLLNENQVLMDRIGVNTPELQAIVTALQEAPGMYGAKISGSGLGDCAVGVGAATHLEVGAGTYHLQMDPKGICIGE